MINTTKQTLDWLWINFYRAMCTRRKLLIQEPCVRSRSWWTTLKQARHRLFLSEPCAHGDRAFVNQLILNDEHRSWFVLMLNLSCTEPCARQARRLLWTKLMIDCQLIFKRAIGPFDGDRAMNKMMMKQARDWFHLETLLLRAKCAATKLVNNAMKQAHDWSWIHFLEPCARRRSLWKR